MDYFKADKAIEVFSNKLAAGKKPTALQRAKFEAAAKWLEERKAEKDAECALFVKYARG